MKKLLKNILVKSIVRSSVFIHDICNLPIYPVTSVFIHDICNLPIYPLTSVFMIYATSPFIL